MAKEGPEKGKSFYRDSSWYHRVKILQSDGTVKYSKKGGFRTQKEADQSYDKCEAAFKNACRTWQMAHQENKNIYFKDYLIYWLEELFAPRVESSSYMVTSYTVHDLILPCIENDIKLKYLNSEYLDALLLNVSRVTKSAGNRARETLNIALKEAVTSGYINRNPVPETKPYRRSKPHITILSKEQIKTLLLAAFQSNWYLEILLGLFCGLRKGEILGLKFSDFDFEKNTVSINRQLSVVTEIEKGSSKITGYRMEEHNPKTYNSFRTLRVPEVVMEEVKLRRRIIQQHKLKNDVNYQDSDYVSCQENGLPHTMASMNIALGKLCERNSLPKVTVHGLRHMYATILIEMGVPLPKISAMLGHSSVHTTFEYYCDEMDERENILAFMNAAFVPDTSEESIYEI